MPLKKLAVGSHFAGRYRINKLLGEGGMGAVYHAQDLALEDPVALKILVPPTEELREYVGLFRQEVKLARRITHANVIHVYDIGEVGDILYMTMELVDGITLRKAMNDAGGKLPLARALRVGHDLANGLAAVHAQGIVHRDLKPGNVMICKSERVVLADFGIASHVDVENQAMRGKLLGTVPYMAPEQFKKAPPTHLTDLYSFGMVMYEALTGALCPRPNPWTVQINEPLVVDLVRAGVMGDATTIAGVETLLRRCLDPDPNGRPASAQEIARVLAELLANDPAHVHIGAGAMQQIEPVDARRPRVPTTAQADAGIDRTTFELAELSAQGIRDDVAQDYLAARRESRVFAPSNLVTAFERLDSCVQREPHFWQAIASRAVVAVRCWFFDQSRSPDMDWERMATASVDMAMEKAPHLSDTHLAAAMLTTQRFEMKQAARSLIRAVEIDPASHEAQEYLGSLQTETGLVDQGLVRLQYAATAIPPRPLPCQVQARCHALFGRFEEAEALLAEASRRIGVPTLGSTFYQLRIHTYRWGKQPINLTMSQRKAVRENNWQACQHYVDALSGTADPHAVATWMDGFISSWGNPRAKMVLRQVCVEMALMVGLQQKALELLDECAGGGLIDILWIDRCPLLDPLRGTTEFKEIRDWVWLNAYGVWN